MIYHFNSAVTYFNFFLLIFVHTKKFPGFARIHSFSFAFGHKNEKEKAVLPHHFI